MICNLGNPMSLCHPVTHSYVSQDSFVNESCDTYDLCTCVTLLFRMCHIHTCEMTHSYVSQNSFACRHRLMYMCDTNFSCVTLRRVTWHIHMRDMTYSYAWHDSLTCVKWRKTIVEMYSYCDMTHAYVWHASFVCVTGLFHMCDMTHRGVTMKVDWLIDIGAKNSHKFIAHFDFACWWIRTLSHTTHHSQPHMIFCRI